MQSFCDTSLQHLGRVHSAATACQAIEVAQQAGFDSINIDLMYGLHQQSIAEAMNDLQQAISFQPQHLSWYQLTIEPHTEYYHKPPRPISHDGLADMAQAGLATLESAGYQRYEVSAYALDNRWRCRHNLNYWQFGDYIGVGAGAASKITDIANKRIMRTMKTKHPTLYMQQPLALVEDRIVLASEQFFEYCMNRLRCDDALSINDICDSTYLLQTEVAQKLQALVDQGYLFLQNDKYIKSDQGKLFLDELLCDLLD